MTTDAARASTIGMGILPWILMKDLGLFRKSGWSMMLFSQLLRESRSRGRRLLPFSRFAPFHPAKAEFHRYLGTSVDGAGSSA
jgi:hypothetical protein